MGNKGPLSFQGPPGDQDKVSGYREYMNNTLEKSTASRDEEKSPDHTQAM